MRVAAVQLSSSGDKAENIARADGPVRAAAADGAQLILLPEKWTAMGPPQTLRDASEELAVADGAGDEGFAGDAARASAAERPDGSEASVRSDGRAGARGEDVPPGRPGAAVRGDGPALAWARSLAAELSVDLVAGSISERRAGDDLLSNTCLHVGPDGEVKAVYRKIHMFDVEVDGRVYEESEAERPGEEIVLSESAGGVPLGLSICYDLRFPELYRILAVRGAKILLVPAAFTLPTTREHWEVLLRSRAIENQAFVIAANQHGPHPGGHRSGGRSMIVDPWGVVLAQASDREGHIVADLDLEALERIRRTLPSLANRRPQAYDRHGEGRA